MISVLLDIGSNETRAGFGGEAQPRLTTDSLLFELETLQGAKQDEQPLIFMNQEKLWGYSVNSWRNDVWADSIFDCHYRDQQHQLGLTSCLPHKQRYSKFVGDLVGDLKEKVNFGQFGVMITEPAYIPRHGLQRLRQGLTTLLIDQFKANAVYFMKSSVATCFAEGKNTALVLDSGRNATSLSRVLDGFQESSKWVGVGGEDTSYGVWKAAEEKGFASYKGDKTGLSRFAEMRGCRQMLEIKKQFAQPKGDIQFAEEVEVELPDKQTVKIRRSEISDPLSRHKQYKEGALPLGWRGLGPWFMEQIESIPDPKYRESPHSLIITGGNALFGDISSRIGEQVNRSSVLHTQKGVELRKAGNFQTSAWTGCSIAAHLSSFGSFWVSAKEWKDNGPSIINKKCPI